MLFEEEEVLIIVQSLQSFPTLGDPVDHNPPDSSVHGIFQAGILESVGMPSYMGSSQLMDRAHVSYFSRTGRKVLYH